jgi:hypothetical protein
VFCSSLPEDILARKVGLLQLQLDQAQWKEHKWCPEWRISGLNRAILHEGLMVALLRMLSNGQGLGQGRDSKDVSGHWVAQAFG